ncbi:hypothetical protein BS47DRAFT_349269 [Hydnum rufescens UP504]|uniref:Uncharacterized protein n=1 Tax=Hydnum rufescens UP504 TaxID=1448309 RepID=A0A9P6DMP8_9AGAM|nr:hypothetical protein BS47DRAFT_349269 [Hydnum rufescens UP504]
MGTESPALTYSSFNITQNLRYHAMVHDTAGTWSFGLFKVSLGSLQRMDYEALINEYNVVEQSGVMKTKAPEQIKEEQHREQQRELERQQLELQIFDAEAKTAEAEARVSPICVTPTLLSFSGSSRSSRSITERDRYCDSFA